MKKNTAAEVSAESMSRVMFAMLEEAPDGYVTQQDLESRIVADLGYAFTAADRRPMKKTGRPKWKNNLDWAKALATKRGLIAVRKQKKTTYIVLVAKTEVHGHIILWAQAKRRKTCMKKRCGRIGCGAYQPLAAEVCERCGHPFPAPAGKRLVLPR